MTDAMHLPLPEGRYVGEMTTEATFGGLSNRTFGALMARTPRSAGSPRGGFINPGVDANTRKVAPCTPEIPTMRSVCVQWSEDEELLSPGEKLILVEDRIDALRSRPIQDMALLTSINELLIVAMALTRLAHGDAGIAFARVLYHLATSYMDLKMFAQAVPHLKQSLSLLEALDMAELQHESQLLLPYMYLRLGVCLFHIGSYPKAIKTLLKALKHNQALQGEEHVENHYFYVALAKTYSAQNEFSKAEEFLQSAWAVKEHFLGRNRGFDEELAQVHIERGKICQKKVAMVEGVLKKTLEQAVPEEQAEQVAQLQQGVPKYAVKQRKQALEAYRQAHEMYKTCVDLTPDLALKSANVEYQIGNLLWHMKQLEAAFQRLEQSAKLYAQHCGWEDHRTLYLMKDCILLVLNYSPRAEPTLFAHSVVVDLPDSERFPAQNCSLLRLSHERGKAPLLPWEEEDDDNDDDVVHLSGDGMCEIGIMRGGLSDGHDIRFGEMDVVRAIPMLKKLLVLEHRAYGRSSPQVAFSFLLLGDCLMEQQEYGKATVMYERARVVYQSYYGMTHDKTQKAKAKLAEAQLRAKRGPDYSNCS